MAIPIASNPTARAKRRLPAGSDTRSSIFDEVLEAAPFSQVAPEALYRLANHRLEERKFDEFANLKVFLDLLDAEGCGIIAAIGYMLNQSLKLQPLEGLDNRRVAFVVEYATRDMVQPMSGYFKSRTRCVWA